MSLEIIAARKLLGMALGSIMDLIIDKTEVKKKLER